VDALGIAKKLKEALIKRDKWEKKQAKLYPSFRYVSRFEGANWAARRAQR
jgi:hypothetical protein